MVPSPAIHRHEGRAALTTFLSMAYIALVVPNLLGSVPGMPAERMVVLTVALCAAGTIFFGLFTRLPYAAGPGIVPTMLLVGFSQSGIPWNHLLGIAAVSGLLIVGLAAFGVLERAAGQTPNEIKTVITFGIGFYLMAVALKSSGLAVSTRPFFEFNLRGGTLPFLAGLAVAFVLDVRKKKDIAILAGIAVATVCSLFPGVSAKPITGTHGWYVIETLTFTYVMVADIVATFEIMALATPELQDNDAPKNFRRSLIASGILCILGPLVGFVPVVVFFESLAGVEAGGRTHVCALLVGLMFVLVSVITPLATVVPPYASAIAIAMIGSSIAKHRWRFFETNRETRYLMFVVLLAVLLFGSITLAVLGAFAVYPLALWRAGRKIRYADRVAAVVSVILIVLEGLR